jgi:hypothetical protein
LCMKTKRWHLLNCSKKRAEEMRERQGGGESHWEAL